VLPKKVILIKNKFLFKNPLILVVLFCFAVVGLNTGPHALCRLNHIPSSFVCILFLK
jgi:hypothetical protein